MSKLRKYELPNRTLKNISETCWSSVGGILQLAVLVCICTWKRYVKRDGLMHVVFYNKLPLSVSELLEKIFQMCGPV